MATDSSPRTSRSHGGRHRKTTVRQPYSWLGPAAFTLGIGAALFGGSAGIAHADDSASAGSPSSDSSDAKVTRAGSVSGDGPTRSGRITGNRGSRQPDGEVGQGAAAVKGLGKNRAPAPSASTAQAPVAAPALPVNSDPVGAIAHQGVLTGATAAAPVVDVPQPATSPVPAAGPVDVPVAAMVSAPDSAVMAAASGFWAISISLGYERFAFCVVRLAASFVMSLS
jgi:hypothetical protein